MLPMAIALLDLLSYVSKSFAMNLTQFIGENLSTARSSSALNNYYALIIVLRVHYGVSVANAEAIFEALGPCSTTSLIDSAFQQTMLYYFAQDPDYYTAWSTGDQKKAYNNTQHTYKYKYIKQTNKTQEMSPRKSESMNSRRGVQI